MESISMTYISQFVEYANKYGIEEAINKFFSNIDESLKKQIIDIYERSNNPAPEIFLLLTK